MTGPVRLEHAKLVAVLQQQAAHRLHQLVLVPRLIVLPALPWILPGVRTTLAFVAFVALPLPFGWWFLEPILLHRCCRFRKCDPYNYDYADDGDGDDGGGGGDYHYISLPSSPSRLPPAAAPPPFETDAPSAVSTGRGKKR